MHEAISLKLGEEITPDTELPALIAYCEKFDIPLQPSGTGAR